MAEAFLGARASPTRPLSIDLCGASLLCARRLAAGEVMAVKVHWLDASPGTRADWQCTQASVRRKSPLCALTPYAWEKVRRPGGQRRDAANYVCWPDAGGVGLRSRCFVDAGGSS